MRSSAAVAVRALVMLACVVGIPALAMWGTSWSDVLKKFQNLRWPAILSPASASSTAARSEAPRFRPPVVAAQPPAIATAPVTAPLQKPEDRLRELGARLQQLGATYYVLESWGNDQQLYRCYCKVAVAGSAAYTHCFEAIQADPLEAMLQVVRQVEAWKNDEARMTNDERMTKLEARSPRS
jgi:hypothetical protein